ncbi:hypothetical protein F4781DRAFT_33071 [Annulohypoxylon bovei var. microspora]|nr:hypothetical protein F4781DRAFT_33071 [Annulohypoxylon bovei var. microspora]
MPVMNVMKRPESWTKPFTETPDPSRRSHTREEKSSRLKYRNPKCEGCNTCSTATLPSSNNEADDGAISHCCRQGYETARLLSCEASSEPQNQIGGESVSLPSTMSELAFSPCPTPHSSCIFLHRSRYCYRRCCAMVCYIRDFVMMSLSKVRSHSKCPCRINTSLGSSAPEQEPRRSVCFNEVTSLVMSPCSFEPHDEVDHMFIDSLRASLSCTITSPSSQPSIEIV